MGIRVATKMVRRRKSKTNGTSMQDIEDRIPGKRCWKFNKNAKPEHLDYVKAREQEQELKDKFQGEDVTGK